MRAIPRLNSPNVLSSSFSVTNLGSLDLLPQAVSLLRGYGLQLWTFWQDLSQMMRLYPNNWESLVNNAAVLQAFGVPGHASRNSWRVILGDDVGVARGGDAGGDHRQADRPAHACELPDGQGVRRPLRRQPAVPGVGEVRHLIVASERRSRANPTCVCNGVVTSN